ncbi:hypothetical protein [Nocardia transvalensis]|uniref:hypothetical protein n=1 Tax=Nocardia transvalensis TaxID=37333 RepID=UPI001893914A|nr:hypothetical protein [Nocardia transvalensis]MBF6330996.1 hypothetical protein [Nocardia transvalensis]
MSDVVTFVVWLLATLAVCAIVYATILCWPTRIPKGKSVKAIRQRVEDEGPRQ